MKVKVDISIVIVCMNNLENLYPCLDSIIQYTSHSYEIFVVAYLFNQENLNRLKSDYPKVNIIESNEIKGFSENNNLALKKASGQYCFVLNDDTFFNTPVIDELINTFSIVDASIVSPDILFPDGSAQCCGRPPMNWYNYVLKEFKLWNENTASKFINQKGIFKTYNVLGAAFMIKTSVFRKLKWFDERYFFCPEDIALSTIANKQGYNIYVNSEIKLYHIGGGSRWSNISAATKPASLKGSLIFHANDSVIKWTIIKIAQFTANFLNYLYCIFKVVMGNKSEKVKAKARKNMVLSVFSQKTPKEIFVKYYCKIDEFKN